MWAKSKDSILVFILVTICPATIDAFIYRLEFHHKAGFFLLGLAAIANIWLQQTSEIDKIEQVFTAKKVQVDGKFPRLVKGEE